jgi:hypothetical protein
MVRRLGVRLSRRAFLASLVAAAGGAREALASPGAGGRVREVAPRWRTLFLPAGGAAALAPRLLHADGRATPWRGAVHYTVADPAVARVGRDGRVTAVGPGRTLVTLRAQGRSASAHVIVGGDRLAHFSREGTILGGYEPGASVFVRTLFGLDPSQVRGHAARLEQVRSAGVNALTTGFYLNPIDHPTPEGQAEWRARWLAFWEEIARTAASSGLGLVLTGDDLARTRRELWHSVSGPWAADSIELAFTRARDSRRVLCVEMVDEVTHGWGDTPRPSDGRWQRETPPVPDDAFATLMRTIDRVRGRPPLSWPVAGQATLEAARHWMGRGSFADYASHYWSDHAEPSSPTGIDADAVLPRILRRLDGTVSRRAAVLPLERPALLLTSVSGPFYTKRVAGDRFQPGRDTLQAPGVPAVACAAEIMYAVATGMAGVRAYQFDATRTRQERAAAAPGRSDLQTGAEPAEVGTDRWQAMAAAFGLIERLEPWILQRQVDAPHLGAALVTGAREGAAGRVLVAVSFSAADETVAVELGAARADGGRITRHRLRGAAVSVASLPAAAVDTLTIRPGEAVCWVWPSARGGAAAPPSVRFETPVVGAVASGVERVRVRADGPRVVSVDLLADGRPLARLRRSPFVATWDTRRLDPGWHALAAIAYGEAGVSEARTAVRVPG